MPRERRVIRFFPVKIRKKRLNDIDGKPYGEKRPEQPFISGSLVRQLIVRRRSAGTIVLIQIVIRFIVSAQAPRIPNADNCAFHQCGEHPILRLKSYLPERLYACGYFIRAATRQYNQREISQGLEYPTAGREERP
jgi:hypothetical protein